MSELNINRNLFLEKEEVSNLQSFLQNSVFFRALMAATYSFGIISNNPKTWDSTFVPSSNFTDNKAFVVEIGSSANSIKINPGYAVTPSGKLIGVESVYDNLNVPANGLYYWIKIGYNIRNYELGSVSVNQKGAVSGSVDFGGKVRGQASKTPVSIRFVKTDGSEPLNNGIYEIVQVINDNNIILSSSTVFVSESDLKVIILGTVPLGNVFTTEQLKGLYTYDYYEISLVQETALNQAPNKGLGEFYLARVVNNNGTITIDNSIKSEWWTLANFAKN